MAIFRKGVKIGNQDVRVGISGERAKGLLRKHGIIEDDKGRKKYAKDAKGSVQLIRTVVGKGEGFTIPANFKVSFKTPRCINQVGADGGTSDSKVRTGGLDWQTHIMNKSTDKEFRKLEWAAQQRSAMMWNKAKGQKYKGGSLITSREDLNDLENDYHRKTVKRERQSKGNNS